ncbi:hypothetical protein B0H15DRAFT_832749 [Mycena belliarum]|uniref:F-box domain-containing protein n=1 Tax=Mycena belliarum TaxID=1033014 RepID=A0AAD6XQW7_9AGAR|nr:hypothetical protein B0H15DRAFT_832749 [Mycena belliae]
MIESRARIELGAPSVFHVLPTEVFIQILPFLGLADLISLLLLSRGVFALVLPVLDEILWHHVHHGDLRWILPVGTVKGEIDRANSAATKWYSNPSGLGVAFDSKNFPFSQFIPVCLKTPSMMNRQRLWKIYKQFKRLWEDMGFGDDDTQI